MSFLLGIYSRKKNLFKEEINPVLKQFKENRVVDENNFNKLFISTLKGARSSFYESANNGVVVWVVGDVLNVKIENVEIEKYGVKISDNINSAEFIFNCYDRLGIDFINKINGVFSIVIYDYYHDKLIVANDHYGLYPIFTYIDNDFFVFSNEYEPILKHKNVKFEIDETALAEYLFLGAPLSGRTFINSISNLAPSTIVCFENGMVKYTNYYRKNIIINRSRKIEDFAEDFAYHFIEAVSSRVERMNDKLCFLTGGIDTRLILSAMNSGQRLNTEFVTLLTSPLNESEDRDVLIAKEISSQLGLKHKIEPMENWENIWTEDFGVEYFKRSKGFNRHIISGHYGSELIKGGYNTLIPTILQIDNSVGIKKIKQLFCTNAFQKQYHNEFINFLKDDYVDKFKEISDNLFDNINMMEAENKELQFAIHYLSRSFFSNMYGGSFGSWSMTYMFPIKFSLPFMDKNILDLLLSIPPGYLEPETQKFYDILYQKHFRKYTHFPTSSCFGRLNHSGMNYFANGKDPSKGRTPNYQKAFKKALESDSVRSLNVFNYLKLNKFAEDGNNPRVRRFVEFSTWLNYVLGE